MHYTWYHSMLFATIAFGICYFFVLFLLIHSQINEDLEDYVLDTIKTD